MDDPEGLARTEPLPAPRRLRPAHVDGRLYADRASLVASLRVAAGGRVAEVGVGLGAFSRIMLDALQPARFDAIDLYDRHRFREHWARRTGKEGEGRTHREWYAERFREEIDRGVVVIMEGDSSSQLEEVPDASYDLIYIDGDHQYEGVAKDAAVAVRKVKPSGTLVFNDYIMFNHIVGLPFGVVHVVNELCVDQGWVIVGFALQPAMFCDVALRRPEMEQHPTD